MLTGELRNQIDSIWDDFWSGGLSNPLQVIEQITYLIFIKRLDEMQELEERKAATLGTPLERRIFPEGYDGRGKPVKPSGPPDPGEPYENLRWSRFKHFEPRRMFAADNGSWWDVGVAEVSNRPRVNQATEQHLQARRTLQRLYR